MMDEENENYIIEVQASAIEGMLLGNPDFIRATTKLVLVELTKLARQKGNLFGEWAQRQVPPTTNAPNVKKRLT
jgi:hypothetical protein